MWRFLKKLETDLSKDPAVPHFDKHSNYSNYYLRDTCSDVLLVALFTIDREWKELRCPPTNKQIMRNVIHFHNVLLIIHQGKQNCNIQA